MLILNVNIDINLYYVLGLAKDESTLKDLKVTTGAKVMVVGSTLSDVLSISKPTQKELKETTSAASTSKEPLSQLKVYYGCHTL
jgi:hypothetical protein